MNKHREEKEKGITKQSKLRSEVFDDSLKQAFDYVIGRGKKAPKINKDETKTITNSKGQVWTKKLTQTIYTRYRKFF